MSRGIQLMTSTTVVPAATVALQMEVASLKTQLEAQVTEYKTTIISQRERIANLSKKITAQSKELAKQCHHNCCLVGELNSLYKIIDTKADLANQYKAAIDLDGKL
ncbi:hypothetical protein BKA81DRAFT_396015 [Phyllosticta paracitricarpa]